MKRDEALVNVRAFLEEDPNAIKIIEFCNLYPIDGWNTWVDGSGYYLKINSDRSLNIGLSLKPKVNMVDDLYFKSPVIDISNNSKLALIAFFTGRNDICRIWFLGNDNKLRACVLFDDDWIENQSALSAGMESLRKIVKNLDIDDCKTVDIGRKLVRLGVPSKMWVTKWPPTKKMILNMMLNYQPIAIRITKDCELLGA